MLLKLFLFIAGLGFAGLFAFAPNSALAANPATINFQGKVVNFSDGTNVSGGAGTTFVFRLYQNVNVNTYNPNSLSCSADTNCLWEETDSLTVTNGVFQVELGAVCPFFTANACNFSSPINFNTSNALSLTMKYAGDSNFMTPLIHLQSVPYAYNADNLGGIGAAGFIQNNTGSAQTGTSFHIDGTGIADVKLQAPSFDTATSNGALGIGTSNAGAISLGNTTNSTFLFTPKSSATAVVFQNTSSKAVVTVNTSSGQLVLGASSAGGVNGSIALKNTSNTNTLTIVTGATAASGGTGYTLTLPTTGASASGQCLQSGSGSTVGSTNLTFSSCGGGGGTFATTYSSTTPASNTIQMATAGGAIVLQDASGTSLTDFFVVQSSTGTTNKYVSISLNSSIPHIKIFNPSDNTKFADIYFDTATSTAVFKSSGTGTTTQIGNSAGGTISIASGSGNAITITAGANSTWSTSAGTLTIDGGGGLNIGTSTSTILIGQTSSGSTQVQSASGLIIGTASVAGQLGVYNGSNKVTIKAGASTATYNFILPASAGGNNQCLVNTATAGTLQWLPCGAGSTGKITLVPEYPGAVMTGDGTSNTGTMTSDFCSGSSLRNIPSTSNPCSASAEHNYYTWVTTSQNDYDIWVRWQVPTDFSDFAASNAVQMYGWRTDSTATTTVTLSLYNASGALCGTSTNVATGTAAWTQTSLGGTVTAAGCSISAGDVVDFRIQLAANNKTVRAGEITINYQRN